MRRWLHDAGRLAYGAVVAHRLRSFVTMLGIVIGITSVILLTSLGEGTRQYVLSEFTQFGTNIIAINPGHIETTGLPGALGVTEKKLTIDDAEALRRVPGVDVVAPSTMGTARVQAGERGRSVLIYGVTAEMPQVLKFGVGQGRFLPGGDPRRAVPLVVLGPKLKRELFGEANALGEHVRIGGQRLLVIGVMQPKGLMLGFDLDDTAWLPVATAQQIFDRDDLMEVDLLFGPGRALDDLVEDVREVMKRRHGDREDFTITTQTEMLDVLNNVLGIVSLAVAGIGAISLVVGAIGILTIMWISVGERTPEVGLERALGATRGQILGLFLLEAALLSTVGGAAGVALGLALAWVARLFFPGVPFETPYTFVVAALGVSLAVGLASGVLPARRAASLDPVEALRAE